MSTTGLSFLIRQTDLSAQGKNIAMAFIRRKSTHLCMPPIMIVDPDDGVAVVDGSIGDLWRCDECDRLWQCRFSQAFPGRIWWKPSWFDRIWFRNHGLKKDAGIDIIDKTMTIYSKGCAPLDPFEPSEEEVLFS